MALPWEIQIWLNPQLEREAKNAFKENWIMLQMSN